MSSFPESFKYVSAEGACEKLWPEGRAVLSMQHTWQGDWNLSPPCALSRSPQDTAFAKGSGCTSIPHLPPKKMVFRPVVFGMGFRVCPAKVGLLSRFIQKRGQNVGAGAG